MLCINPKTRPDIYQILNRPEIKQKTIEYIASILNIDSNTNVFSSKLETAEDCQEYQKSIKNQAEKLGIWPDVKKLLQNTSFYFQAQINKEIIAPKQTTNHTKLNSNKIDVTYDQIIQQKPDQQNIPDKHKIVQKKNYN